MDIKVFFQNGGSVILAGNILSPAYFWAKSRYGNQNVSKSILRPKLVIISAIRLYCAKYWKPNVSTKTWKYYYYKNCATAIKALQRLKKYSRLFVGVDVGTAAVLGSIDVVDW